MSTDSRHVFLSHASQDDGFVRLLRKKLEDHRINVWADSRNLRGGDKLSPEIETAIRTASNFLVVISPNTINSDWVFDEIKIAEQVEKENPDYRAIPLMLPGIKPAALKRYFSEEPAGEIIETEVGKLDEQLPHIMAALGHRAPDHDLPKADEVENKPMAELLLELSEPCLTTDNNGAEKLSARAELTYIPHDISKEREVKSRPFRFTAPIGKKEQEEISWYLEQYLLWPVGSFRNRAEKTESQLAEWGQALFTTALGQDVCQQPLTAWQQARNEVERRFSVQVDASTLEHGQEAILKANEAASRLQSLPWELLHDDSYLSDGANPVRIRRRLPNYKQQVPSLTDLPIRILLLSPRPEEKGIGYIDHRASALPLVEAVEKLGDLVQLKILSPPTLAALEKELQSARDAKMPYHVLHFDGHGIYDKQHGLGALCFENPNDANKLEGRQNELVHADKLAKLLKDFSIPLVFLEACQTAQSEENPNASVAASLLEEGITSVVAMSHSVLVETAKRFVTKFYQALAKGQRVGAAMLAGQKELMRNTYRLPIQGAGDFHLQDWFVPILYQEQHDLQLFAWIPSEAAQKMQKQQRQTRLGRLPEPPEHSFIGRSRDLLKAERLLTHQSYVVIRGQGGAGKTTVAVELTRWLVKSRRFNRCAFVSVKEYTHDSAVVEILLQQLVNANYNLAAEYGGNVDQALQAIQRTLENERTLIVIDNMESLLADTTNKQAVLDMLARLPEAKLLFTTREALPEPFHHKAREIKLGELGLNDAKSLVMKVMNNEGLSLRHDDAGNTPQEVNDLVQSVGCHARALVLLARELAQRGVTATTENVREIMQDLERRYPEQRENSLFASVELSLRRLSPKIRKQIYGLSTFKGGGVIWAIGVVLELDRNETISILSKLVEVGLASSAGTDYYKFDPSFSFYLDTSIDKEQRYGFKRKCLAVTEKLFDFIYENFSKDTNLSYKLIHLDLLNILSMFDELANDFISGTCDEDLFIDKLFRFEQLLMSLNYQEALGKVKEWQKLVNTLNDGSVSYSRERFFADQVKIERLQRQGALDLSLIESKALLNKIESSDFEATDKDFSIAHALLGRSLRHLSKLKEGEANIEKAIDYAEKAKAKELTALFYTDLGDCLRDGNSLQDAELAYKKSAFLCKEAGNFGGNLIANFQRGSALLDMKKLNEALEVYDLCWNLVNDLGEHQLAAPIWHQIGSVHSEIGNLDAAEQAYRKSLSINNKNPNKNGEAKTLHRLCKLYKLRNSLKESVDIGWKAADIYKEIADVWYEGGIRNSIANSLIKLERYDEARTDLVRAIECKKPYVHDAQIWNTWSALYDLEQTCGKTEAALLARKEATDAYLAYRRDGGENNSVAGCLVLEIGRLILNGNITDAQQLIEDTLIDDSWDEHKNFLQKLQAIVVGNRNLALVKDERFNYILEVELILLLEFLG
ncbi:CHAT domain-containing protein [Leucothrix arctica]|uniref:TIR domain-containing protein n=1 Tax=Leucothrix arctica TaxID=1481894 RepID=A0A317C7P5_9GAMM|nr:CHAT domain-containing protein [Leucothrix arctica]PWQ93393.1 hypothetical protein DKT75_17310 [Leucothrix arctica]